MSVAIRLGSLERALLFSDEWAGRGPAWRRGFRATPWRVSGVFAGFGQMPGAGPARTQRLARFAEGRVVDFVVFGRMRRAPPGGLARPARFAGAGAVRPVVFGRMRGVESGRVRQPTRFAGGLSVAFACFGQMRGAGWSGVPGSGKPGAAPALRRHYRRPSSIRTEQA